jgi:hypothetical protein
MVVKKMANPLARVVMKNIVSKKGIAVNKRSGNSSREVNLSSREDDILKSILNKGQKNVTIETLSSLNTKKPASSSNYTSKPSSTGNNETKGLGTLKTLDALSIGNKASKPAGSSQAGYGAASAYGKQLNAAKSGGVKAVSLETLVSGKSSDQASVAPVKSEPIKDGRQQGGMMSLNQLAGNKVNSSSNDVKPQSSEKVKTSVRGNVMGSLSDYIPKVTLDSIGKKGSLF